jgi:uncharacterized protein (DUF1697 family)
VPRYAVLLRGVNVGGSGTTLKMEEFRTTLAEIGCRDVATYIQSGNAVVTSDLTAPDLSRAIARAVTLPNGTHPATLVLGADALADALAANPFLQADAVPKSLHLVFLDRDTLTDTAALTALAAPDEAFAIKGRVFYLYAPSGIGRSKLAEKMGRHFGSAQMTGRNLATVRTLVAMMRVMPGG